MMAMYSEIEQRSNSKLQFSGVNKSQTESIISDSTIISPSSNSMDESKNCSDENEDPNASLTGKPLVTHFAGIKRQTISISPDTYICELCGERPVDTNIAKEIQQKLSKNSSPDDNIDFQKNETLSVKSDTETKDSTNHLIVDRALQLGLLDDNELSGSVPCSELQNKRNMKKGNDTNVNLRIPSPPRASKRKQDLTTSSYKDVDPRNKTKTREIQGLSSEESSPSVTPLKMIMSPATPVSSESKPDTGKRSREKRCLMRKNQSQVAFDPNHNPLGTAWTKNYREADHNMYTKTLSNQVLNRVLCNMEKNYAAPPSCFSRNPLCRVVLFDHNDKGLEGSISLSINEMVIEVRGKMLLLEEYEHFSDPISDYNRYAMIYRGFSDRVITIDASAYGNDARFIRRSCVPNCKLDHIIINSKLHIVIRTICEISPGTELTIPFDIDYRALHYPVDCACCRSRCPVFKWSKKLMRNKVVPNMDYSKYIESQLKVLSTPLGQEGAAVGWSSPGTFDSPNSNSIISMISPRSTPSSTPMSTPAKANLLQVSSPRLPTTPLSQTSTNMDSVIPIPSNVRKRLFASAKPMLDKSGSSDPGGQTTETSIMIPETNLDESLPNKRRRKKKQLLDL